MLDFLEMPNATYEHKIAITYRLAAYHFLRKEYVQSRAVLEQIFLTITIKADVSYFLPIRVIYILSLSELKEFHFAEKELVSLKRKMKRDETNSLLIDKLFLSLTNLIKEINHTEKRQHHLKELVALREYEAKYTFFLKKIFVILEWAEQQIK